MPSELLAERARYERAAGAMESDENLTVHRLCLRYLGFAESYYSQRPGKPSNEIKNIRDACKSLFLYSSESAGSFSAMRLRACREWMIDQGYARSTINQRIQKIRRMFKWASSRGLVSSEIWHQLQSVEALAPNRSQAKETQPVKPVPESQFWPVLAFMSPPIRAMAELQWWTGARPGEVVVMTGEGVQMQGLEAGDLVQNGSIPSPASAIWTFSPEHHKNEWRGPGHKRTIYLGPHAQSILQPFMKPGYLFLSRYKLPFTVNGYGGLVRKACDRAGIEPWSPNRLRHSAATRYEELYGEEIASMLLGHASIKTTQTYIHRDMARVLPAVMEAG